MGVSYLKSLSNFGGNKNSLLVRTRAGFNTEGQKNLCAIKCAVGHSPQNEPLADFGELWYNPVAV